MSGLEIPRKIQNGTNGTGGFTVPEFNKIVKVLDKATDGFTGVDALKKAISVGATNTNLYLKYVGGEDYKGYDLDIFKAEGTLSNIETLEGVNFVHIYTTNDESIEDGVREIEITLKDNSVVSLSTANNKPVYLEKNTVYLGLINGTELTLLDASTETNPSSKLDILKLVSGGVLQHIKTGTGVVYFKSSVGDGSSEQGVAIVTSAITIEVNGIMRSLDKGVYVIHGGEYSKFLSTADKFLTSPSSVKLVKKIHIPNGTKDSNGMLIPFTSGISITIGSMSILYTRTLTYTKAVNATLWNYTGDMEDPNYFGVEDFYTTFTITGDAKFIFNSGAVVSVMEKNTKVITSINSDNTTIPAGEYVLKGKDVTEFKFKNDVFTKIHMEKTKGLTRAYEMFDSLTKLTTFTANPNTFGDVTEMYSAWYNCHSLTSFPVIDTSSAISIFIAWNNCHSLTSFPVIDTSKVTIMNASWYNCHSLTSFPAIDISKVTQLTNTWYNCRSLTSFPALDTSKVTEMYSVWYNCRSLTSFPAIDISKVTQLTNTWSFCTSLVTIQGVTNNNVAPTTVVDVFSNTPALTRPTAAEQTSILNGNSYHV